MIEGLFFDRVNAKAAASAIRREDHLPADVLTNKTEPPLSIGQRAMSGTKGAENSVVFDRMPEAAGVGLRRLGDHFEMPLVRR